MPWPVMYITIFVLTAIVLYMVYEICKFKIFLNHIRAKKNAKELKKLKVICRKEYTIELFKLLQKFPGRHDDYKQFEVCKAKLEELKEDIYSLKDKYLSSIDINL